MKELYIGQDRWDQLNEPLLQELSKALMPHTYAALLATEGEAGKLVEAVKQHKSYIMLYGKRLAENFKEEVYEIYEEYILEESKEATDRVKYKGVCKIIKNFFEAGAQIEAVTMIDRLSEMFPRRPAMLEELAALKRKLNSSGARYVGY